MDQQGQAEGFPARAAITEQALNEKIMVLLRARPACADARSVMLDQVTPSENLPYTWAITHFDPGQGDRYRCKMAVRAIHEALRDQYDLIGRS